MCENLGLLKDDEMSLELPVDNKGETVAKAIAGTLFVSVILVFIFIVISDWEVLYFLMFFSIFWIAFSVRLIRKNSIDKVILVDTMILVYHNKKCFEISLKDVKQVSLAVNFF